MMIDTGTGPACGRQGAARKAAKSAAFETIRAGYDRYIIAGAQSQNDVSMTHLPGQARNRQGVADLVEVADEGSPNPRGAAFLLVVLGRLDVPALVEHLGDHTTFQY